MDTKVELSKLGKEISQSAKEFASHALQVGSKALDFTAAQIKVVEAELKKRAEKWAPAEKAEEGKGGNGAEKPADAPK